MLKRILSLCLAAALFIAILPTYGFSVSAEEQNVPQIISLEDGGTLEIEIRYLPRTRGASISLPGEKVYRYKDKNGTLCWEAVLSATFVYDGKSSSCLNASCSTKIYNASYYVVSKNAYTSGNSAIANITMGYRVTGQSVQKTPITMKLTCSASGVLS